MYLLQSIALSIFLIKKKVNNLSANDKTFLFFMFSRNNNFYYFPFAISSFRQHS